ncbi:MAG: hypothetical protein IJY99_04755 [Alphaproteobacteria bacterium]|nr:hypothetical protein [Alphaproteobacteria bacterium]
MNALELMILLENIQFKDIKPKGKYDTSNLSATYRYEIKHGADYIISERSIADIRYPNAPYSYRLRVEHVESANKKTLQYDGCGMLARAVFETLNAKERGR